MYINNYYCISITLIEVTRYEKDIFMARPKKENGKVRAVLIRMDISFDNAVNEFMKTQNIDNKSEAIRTLASAGLLKYYLDSLDN